MACAKVCSFNFWEDRGVLRWMDGIYFFLYDTTREVMEKYIYNFKFVALL